jgi:hypothetical protein
VGKPGVGSLRSWEQDGKAGWERGVCDARVIYTAANPVSWQSREGEKGSGPSYSGRAGFGCRLGSATSSPSDLGGITSTI